MKILVAFAFCLQATGASNLRANSSAMNPPEDPYLWLEDIRSEASLEWVAKQNSDTIASLESRADFNEIYNVLLQNENSPDHIPFFEVLDGWLYNFWQDQDHVRGIWRRTTLASYKNDTTEWETVLDVDQLSEDENENWVMGTTTCIDAEQVRCMIALSRGGSDAHVTREFDLDAGSFVENGFFVSEAITRIVWKDIDTLWIATDFGDGSMSTSGYPRFVKEWVRGTPLQNATTLIEGKADGFIVTAGTIVTTDGTYVLLTVRDSLSMAEHYLRTGNGELVQLDVPGALESFFQDHMLVRLGTEWNISNATYASGALIAIPLDAFLSGCRVFHVIFQPTERVFLATVSRTENHLIYTTLDNVRNRMYRATVQEAGEWMQEEIELPGLGSASLDSGSGINGTFFITYSDFLTPATLYQVHVNGQYELVKSSPSLFNATGLTVDQYEATSKDGTLIPYFIVRRKNLVADGNNPTLLYGYGGFGVPLQPDYYYTTGAAWIERGGVYVVANVRGGGEFGPKWHLAAIRENHQKTFDDFIAVAEDLIDRNVTSPARLAIMGESQGGLLVGATFVQRPDLFGAVSCHVPLLDMRRFSKLLKGATWIDEYGDPDTEDWENFISSWSPYHNLHPDEKYPRVFFQTNTNDDRVHPGHARKMAAKMIDMGHPVYFYEATEGGHGGGLANQLAYVDALTYTYLWKTLLAVAGEHEEEEDSPASEASKQSEDPALP